MVTLAARRMLVPSWCLSTVARHHRHHARHHGTTRHPSWHHHADHLTPLTVDLRARVRAEVGLAMRWLARVQARCCKDGMASNSHGAGKVRARQIVGLVSVLASWTSVLMWRGTSSGQELCGARTRQWVLHEHWRGRVDVRHCQLLAGTCKHVTLVWLAWHWAALGCVRCLRPGRGGGNSGRSWSELFCSGIQ